MGLNAFLEKFERLKQAQKVSAIEAPPEEVSSAAVVPPAPPPTTEGCECCVQREFACFYACRCRCDFCVDFTYQLRVAGDPGGPMPQPYNPFTPVPVNVL